MSLHSEQILSKTITWLRLPLIVFVVFVHMNPNVDVRNIDYYNFTTNDLYTLISTTCSYIIGPLAIPAFYLFAGYLYFKNFSTWDWNTYRHKTKTRFFTLVIPYLIWNLFPYFENVIRCLIKNDGCIWWYFDLIHNKGYLSMFWDYHSWFNAPNILSQKVPMYGPYNLPLWFLRDLIVIGWLSPVVFFFLKKLKVIGIILLGFFYYSAIWWHQPGIGITGVFFFSLGAYFSICKVDFLTQIKLIKPLFYMLTLVLGSLKLVYYNTPFLVYIDGIFSIAGVFTIVLLVSNYLEKTNQDKWVNSLSKTSFFIYALHTNIILNACKELIQPLRLSGTIGFQMIYYFTTPVLITGACVLIYKLFELLLPSVLKVLAGGR